MTYESASDLTYVDMCMSEAMRLFPPGFMSVFWPQDSCHHFNSRILMSVLSYRILVKILTSGFCILATGFMSEFWLQDSHVSTLYLQDSCQKFNSRVPVRNLTSGFMLLFQSQDSPVGILTPGFMSVFRVQDSSQYFYSRTYVNILTLLFISVF